MQLNYDGYVYPSVRVDANPKFDDKKEKTVECETQIGFSFDLRSSKFNVNLIVNSAENLDNLPYIFDIHVIGAFSIDTSNGKRVFIGDRPSIERQASFILRNACVLLYSSVRDYLHTITGKAPFGNDTLPSAFFNEKEIFKGASEAAGDESEDVADLLIKHGLVKLSE